MFVRKEICGMCSMALAHSRLFSLYVPGAEVTETMEDIMLCEQINHKVIILKVEKD